MPVQHRRLDAHGVLVSNLCLGTMNFGRGHQRRGQLHDHGPGPGAGHQLLRHRQRLRLETGRRLTEQIIGRWFAQGGGRRERGRPGHQGLRPVTRANGRAQRRRSGLSAIKITRGLRGQPAPPADRPHRSLPDAPHRPRRARGKRSGRPSKSSSQQGKVLYVGLEQLRRLGHRHRLPGSRRQRGFLGLVSEQSIYNLNSPHDRAGGDPGLPALRPGRDPLEPAGRRPAGRRRWGRPQAGGAWTTIS